MTARRSQRSEPWWASLPDDELLDVRLSDLRVRVETSPLAPRIERLQRDLARAGLRFRPYVWFSTDWFTPIGLTGFAVPFYLGHPRLLRLERRHGVEVEGADAARCAKLLRHETGHAIDNAYGLHRRKRWRDTFGLFSAPYRPWYVPRPGSRAYVIHLDNWYAQSHPMEDFAESFAVWLQPRSGWRQRYAGWPAFEKLVFVDELMREIGPRPPRVRTRERTDSLATLRITLKEHYRRKRARVGRRDRSAYDDDLKRLFPAPADGRRRQRASRFLRDRVTRLRGQVVRWSGHYPFVVDEVIHDMIERSRELRLVVTRPLRETERWAAVIVAVHTARVMRRSRPEYWR